MDITEVWTDLIRQMKSYPNVNASQIDAFFSRIQIQAVSSGFIIFTSNNSFIKDWIEKHYLKDIKQALEDLYGVEFMVQIEVDTATTPLPIPDDVENIPVSRQHKTQSEQPLQQSQQSSAQMKQMVSHSDEREFREPPHPQSAVDAQKTHVDYQAMHDARAMQDAQASYKRETTTHNDAMSRYNELLTKISSHEDTQESHHNQPSFSQPTPQHVPELLNEETPLDFGSNDKTLSNLTFDTFVIGESNRMAYSMAVEVADRPRTSSLNPLFIYGRSGVGKTHLLCAIQNYIREQYPDLNVCYIDSMELVNKYSDAAIEKSVDKQSFKNFENFFEQADVLLIDDIQGLQGKPGTLNALFRIFNNLIPKGKQFVFSADRAPKNIDLDERYVSRFNSGATIDIQPPDNETKRNIILNFIRQYKREEGGDFFISEKILDYIVEHSSANIRELKSAITNVIFAVKMDKSGDISEQRVKELLANHFISEGSSRITIEVIQHAVEDFYDVSHNDLVSNKRSRRIAHPRQVAIYLCRELLEATFKTIGEAFNRDHSTIMHSYDLINNGLGEDRNLREEIEAIREKIRIQQY